MTPMFRLLVGGSAGLTLLSSEVAAFGPPDVQSLSDREKIRNRASESRLSSNPSSKLLRQLHGERHGE